MAKPLVLIVEPDTILVKTYAEALTAAGYEVALASSVRAAIDSAESGAPDLVVLEIELAGHNGIEFLHEFRSYDDWQNIPVVINSNVSPSKFAASKKELRLLGVSQYLYKPKASLARLVGVVGSELAA